MAVLGRFSARNAAPQSSSALPVIEAPQLEPSLLDDLANSPEPEPAGAQNLLLTSKMLDAKVRLHRKVIEEFNLSAMDKMPEDEVRRQVYNMVSQFTRAERIALNANELDDFVSGWTPSIQCAQLIGQANWASWASGTNTGGTLFQTRNSSRSPLHCVPGSPPKTRS